MLALIQRSAPGVAKTVRIVGFGVAVMIAADIEVHPLTRRDRWSGERANARSLVMRAAQPGCILAPEATVDEQGRKRVLVVDDDIEVLSATKRLIEDEAAVQVALGAEAALKHMEKMSSEGKNYDMVIVDFTMKGPNGAWLLRAVRDKYPDCERVLISGHSYMDLANFLDPGLVQRFLEKPFEFEELLDAVVGE
jgi:CheY-like chemotaxis protein